MTEYTCDSFRFFNLFPVYFGGKGTGFTKMTDHFVDQFLTKEGETVEEAKARLAREQAQRKQRQKEQETSRGQRPKER